MRMIIAALFLAFVMPAQAKDTALTSAWSGMWSDASGQHRCAIQIVDGEAGRLSVLCHLGPDGVYANMTPNPPPGWQIFVDQPKADFGSPGEGHMRWGQISWHGLCDSFGPKVVANVATAYSQPTAVDAVLRPLTVSNPAALCTEASPGARQSR